MIQEPPVIPIPLAKRQFDIVVCLILTLLLSPIIIAILLAMLIESIFVPSSRGRFLYSETRVSQGQPFTLYKFRIFKDSALRQYLESNGIIQTKELERNAANLTYTGRILKQVYLDEIPQMFDVLKGDMTLVGPRPTNLINYQHNLERGGQAKRLLKAGITGYFQSHKGLVLDKNQESMDMEYAEIIKNNPGWRVVLFDLKIILISIKTVLRAEGI